MPDTPPRRSALHRLWMLPAFALVSPPIVWVLALVLLVGGPPLGRRLGDTLWEAFVWLGCLAPVLGLVTLAVLLVEYVIMEDDPMRINRRRVAVLADLAVISPAWLFVMFFAVAVFHR